MAMNFLSLQNRPEMRIALLWQSARVSALSLLYNCIPMLRLEIGFVPGPFERRVVQQTKEDIQQRLEGYDFGFLRIVIKRRPGGFAFQFFGPTENVEKAKGLLGIY